jgi:hypothetical protein
MHQFREVDAPVPTLILMFIFVIFAFEFDLHKSLSDSILSAIVPSNDRTDRISKERIDEKLTVIDEFRVIGHRKRKLLVLRELPILFHSR